MDNIIHNLINGNISAAKQSAKRYSSRKIFRHAYISMGFPIKQALVMANYLKGKVSWETYCAVQN
jgi:hypothetical protein